jgi:flagellar biosynthesis GTPase FlhF
MVIQTCQAANLAELMAKIQKEYGPDAALISVRRIDLPIRPGSPAFQIEGTIGVNRKAEPIAVTVARQQPVAVPIPVPKPAQPYQSPIQAPAATARQDSPKLPAQVKPAGLEVRRELPLRPMLPREIITREIPTRATKAEEFVKREENAESNFIRRAITAATAPRSADKEAARTSGKFGTHAVALVGPLGAGKTTTTAKIAGRLKSQRKEPVGVVSTDMERPGGATLLLAYAQDLQLQATTASSASELRNRMERWGRRGPLVIDTRGCGPRDSLAIERMNEMFNATGFEIERYLVLSATEHPVVARQCLRNFDELELNGVILTRVDQAAGIGHCLEEVRKSGLPILFAGTGEAVPQDLVEPTATTFRALEIQAATVAV